jgi:hypothetical protein
MIRVRIVLTILGEIVWRSFGLFLKYLPAGVLLGAGGTVATGDKLMFLLGLLVAFIPALLEAYAEIGEEIARTAKVTKTGISRGFNKAIRILEEQAKEAKGK